MSKHKPKPPEDVSLSPGLQEAVAACVQRVQPVLGNVLRPEALQRVVTVCMAAVYPVASRAAMAAFADGLRIAAEKTEGDDRALLLDVADMIPDYEHTVENPHV